MNNELSVLLIGGPDAGKSNYLFRLWLAIDSQTGALSSDGLPNDIEYLKTGVMQLLRGEFAAKTPIDVHNQSIIPVKFSREQVAVRGTLVMPDCAGEQWLAIYRKREWSEEWEQLVREGCGCLIFVRADSNQIVPVFDWISYFKQFGTTVAPTEVLNVGQTDAPGAAVRTTDSQISSGVTQNTQTPTQVVLVDWLQCLKQVFASRVPGNHRPRVGIVIAAWDSIPGDQQNITPNTWLEANFPLLSHFLESNATDYVFEVFGISIVGGDLKNDVAFRKAYRNGEPAKAGYVVLNVNGRAQRHPDVTLPVAWAMGCDKTSFIEAVPGR